MTEELKHMDCRNYAPLDVAKGICHRTKELVMADADHCEHFAATQKCKFCDYFVATSQYLGSCGAVLSKPMTYPDLIAVTCENFVRAKAPRRSQAVGRPATPFPLYTKRSETATQKTAGGSADQQTLTRGERYGRT